ncbi:hypothetical protein AY599_24240 [Leptolyngbya valderiana BDU 20041]|uniref:calcium-binding protein n=1 Tax=Baaleninema simplex TaxID=2862350 RepID=UPI0003456F84|nr:calcium-binding protein [Baaleninema simplex]OAB60259.1 hypothetical protein AY599_24240 [Leptolyngbya valderiana BDU 20041]PPT10529.1 hypothetical protein CKA32_004226 [Geitlerinema sp. FC II]
MGDRNTEREHRIDYEIVVDAYTPEEQAMGWYVYLDDRLDFPFSAQWITQGNRDNPQKLDIVEVVAMAAEEECMGEMYVEIRYAEDTEEDEFSVPLSEIRCLEDDDNLERRQCIEDWHYWVDMGYELG